MPLTYNFDRSVTIYIIKQRILQRKMASILLYINMIYQKNAKVNAKILQKISNNPPQNFCISFALNFNNMLILNKITVIFLCFRKSIAGNLKSGLMQKINVQNWIMIIAQGRHTCSIPALYLLRTRFGIGCYHSNNMSYFNYLPSIMNSIL